MAEKAGYYNDEFDEENIKLPKRAKFRDSEGLPKRVKKLKLKAQHAGRSKPKKTLYSNPASPSSSLIREAGLSARLLSDEAIQHAETFFKINIARFGLNQYDLENWFKGVKGPKQNRVLKRMRGRLFEEVATREFHLIHPNYFVTNPALTHHILQPIIAVLKPNEISHPDHLVFARYGPVNTLVGFMEDKKTINMQSTDKLLQQLDGEWNLWLKLSEDHDLQSKFKQELFRNIPTIAYHVRVASTQEGKIWLVTTKETAIPINQLPGWVQPTPTSISGEAINRLTESLVQNSFLPNIVRSQARTV